jgi:hypothetical protein
MEAREKRGVPFNYLQKALFPNMPMYQYKRMLAKEIKERQKRLAEQSKGEGI